MKYLEQKFSRVLGMAVLALATFVLAPAASAAPPNIVQSSDGPGYDTSSPSTESVTIGASDRILIVTAITYPNATPTVTFNGDAMTLHATQTHATHRLQTWYLIGPDSGTHDIEVSGYSGSTAFGWITLDTDEVPESPTYNTGGLSSITVTDAAGAPSADHLQLAFASCNNSAVGTVTGGNTYLWYTSLSNEGNARAAYGANEATTFTNGGSNCTWEALTFQLESSPVPPSPGCTLHEANAAATASGDQTIYARGSCSAFFPSSAWLGAVRIDPIGSHIAWSEGLGPFPDPYELETSDVPSQIMSNGTWRVRMYGKDGDVLYVSGYIDVVLDGSPYVPLTAYGSPEGYELDPDDPALTPATTGNGYTFSASTVAIAAQGGLVITADGCAAIGEDATSTNCVFADNTNFLYRTFPLLTWPMGMFQAALNAQQALDSATPTYSIALPSHGDWIPAVILVDSASRTLGIGAWIPVAQQEFFRSIVVFSVWAAFVIYMKRKADRLL